MTVVRRGSSGCLHLVPALAVCLLSVSLGAEASLRGVSSRLDAEDAPSQSVLPQLPPWAVRATGGNAAVFSRHYLGLQGGLKTLNPFLTDDDLNDVLFGEDCKNRGLFERCGDTPSLFSGLGLSRSGNFIGIGDRGQIAVQDCARMDSDFKAGNFPVDEPNPRFNTGKGFVVPKAAPAFAEMSLSFTSLDKVLESGIELRRSCYLRRDDGSPVTGLPATKGDPKPRDFWCQNSLDLDRGGIDSEAISVIPGSDFCIGADEYGPSLFVFNCNFDDQDSCGKVAVRYVPEGLSLKDAGYTVKEILPKELRNRHGLRGFHGISVSPDGKSAFALMRIPLGPRSDLPESLITQVIKLDLTNPLRAKVSARHLYTMDGIDEWRSDLGVKEKHIKLHSSFWASQETSACPDRPLLLVMEQHAPFQMKMYLADFSDATDISGHKLSRDRGFEKKAKDLEKLKIKPAKKTLVLDTTLTDGWDSALSQDSAIIYPGSNGCVVAIGDDSFDGSGTPGITLVQLGMCIPDLYKASGGEACSESPVALSGQQVRINAAADDLCSSLTKKRACNKSGSCKWISKVDACIVKPENGEDDEEETADEEAEEVVDDKEEEEAVDEEEEEEEAVDEEEEEEAMEELEFLKDLLDGAEMMAQDTAATGPASVVGGSEGRYVTLEGKTCFRGVKWARPNGRATAILSDVPSVEACQAHCTTFNKLGVCVGASYLPSQSTCYLYSECNLKEAPLAVTVMWLPSE